jgi:hypothetical protein
MQNQRLRLTGAFYGKVHRVARPAADISLIGGNVGV